MKKTTIIGLLILSLLVSCKPTTVLDNHKETSLVQKDSTAVIKTIEKSEAITDTLKIAVPELKTGSKNIDCDSLCNARFKDFLRNVNTKKTSGNNSQGFYYDQYKNLLVAYGSQGEALRESNEQLTIKNTDKSVSEVKQIAVKLPLTKTERILYNSGIALWVLIVAISIYAIYKLYRKFSLT